MRPNLPDLLPGALLSTFEKKLRNNQSKKVMVAIYHQQISFHIKSAGGLRKEHRYAIIKSCMLVIKDPLCSQEM